MCEKGDKDWEVRSINNYGGYNWLCIPCHRSHLDMVYESECEKCGKTMCEKEQIRNDDWIFMSSQEWDEHLNNRGWLFSYEMLCIPCHLEMIYESECEKCGKTMCEKERSRHVKLEYIQPYITPALKKRWKEG